MARRSRRPSPAARPIDAPPPLRVSPQRQTGLRPTSALPVRAQAFLLLAGLAILGFLIYISVRLLAFDSRGLAILLIVLCCLGSVVIASAVLTLTRLAYSLRALPYLLGRGLRRVLLGRLGGR